ncbi:MAG: polyamine ABC transporter substrate-binding protein [Alphaproteobacteria bacterium]|nr:polyamine ABC transporter substrate-binding protein [Alphaproteobacteria bacterium]
MERAGIFAFGLGLLLAVASHAQERVVNVYNWTDYIDETVLAEFTAKTGIKVRYDTFDSNDVLETKLLAGKTGYDIVVPTSTYLSRLARTGVLAKLDKALLPNLRHLDPELNGRLARLDPDNAHGVIYLWGTTGIGLNADKIKARMAKPPANSLAMIFDPAVIGKFADCGVNLLDAPDEMIPAALRYLGHDPDAKDDAALAKAEAALLKIRPFIRKFHSSQYVNDLANGDVCLVFGWSGDILQAKTRAEEAKNGVRIQYLIPKEGALLWFDTLAVPVDAPHKAEAHAFIDFLMNPEMIARISNKVQYPNANAASWPLVAKEAMADRDVWPTAETRRGLYTITPNGQREQRAFTRVWTKVKGAN